MRCQDMIVLSGRGLSAVVCAGLVLSHESAMAVVGGQDSPDTPLANATVSVNGASGTLVSNNIVVTNGHVTNVVPPPMSPPFSRTNAHDPGQWHPLRTGQVNVFLGAPNLRMTTTRRDALTSPRTRLTLDDRNRGDFVSGDTIGLTVAGGTIFLWMVVFLVAICAWILSSIDMRPGRPCGSRRCLVLPAL